MKNNKHFIRSVTVFIIFSFILVGVSPIFLADNKKISINSDLIEYNLEIYEKEEINCCSVNLTKAQINAMDVIFGKVYTKLKFVKNKEELLLLIKEALILLREQGIISDSIGNKVLKYILDTVKEKPVYSKFIDISDVKNSDCFIIGKTFYTRFWDGNTNISFGWVDLFNDKDVYESPAIGWIFTYGSNGFKSFLGNLYGQIRIVSQRIILPLWTGIIDRYYHVGIRNFIGIKLSGLFLSRYIGFASFVSIDNEPFYIPSINLDYKNDFIYSNFVKIFERFPFIHRLI